MGMAAAEVCCKGETTRKSLNPYRDHLCASAYDEMAWQNKTMAYNCQHVDSSDP
jgi:hypothetical protein